MIQHVFNVYIVNMPKAPWWTSGLELLVPCSCHTDLKFIKLSRFWCSLITPANKHSLIDTGWTLEIIQHVFNVYIVNMLKAPWWTSGLELLVPCSCHTVLKFIKLPRCWCSLITPANKHSLTDTGWTLEIIQYVFNVYIVNMLKAPWWTNGLEFQVHCGWCCTVLKFIKLTRYFCSLITPTNKTALTDTGWTLKILQHVFNVYIVNMLKAPDEPLQARIALLYLLLCFELY